MDFSQEELFDAIDRLVNGLLERAGVRSRRWTRCDIAEDHLGIPVEVVEPVEEDEHGRRGREHGRTGRVSSCRPT